MQMGGNVKMAVPLTDGLAVEAVWYGSGTLCISSQVGCALGCPFCASGFGGLRRSLSTDELFLQLETARKRGAVPQRVTVSGIGEPLHNPQAVAVFVEECRRQGLPVSLTTTGSPLTLLQEFLHLPHNGLMLSLHAGTAATHRRLVPRGPDLDALWSLLEEALPALSRRRRRKIGINYLLLAGCNDSPAELSALAERLRHQPELTLHLLTCNPVAGSPFVSPPPPVVDAVHGFLTARGLNIRRPNRWRTLAEGGCGTLLARS
ncbi:MAG TPA: radical SAM protein [Desulfuromonadales bacterium]|nr:radical SAM protein [Desulfuromonadales bacterium]